jgi:hypothetical protein
MNTDEQPNSERPAPEPEPAQSEPPPVETPAFAPLDTVWLDKSLNPKEDRER